MNFPLINLVLVCLAAADAATAPAVKNPVFRELVDRGVKMSDGAMFELPPPIMPDGLDAAAQRAAMAKVATAHSPVDKLVQKSFYAPVVVKVRTLKAAEGEGPAVRAVDLWFVAHGDWDTLTSKEFLESVTTKEQGKSRVVSKSGVLSDEEMAERKLSAAAKDGIEERFVYTTFSLFERVQISATRLAAATDGEDFILAAGKIDPRFNDDPEYPNQWRPLLRDVRAEIELGPAQPFRHAGGYAKITRLINADTANDLTADSQAVRTIIGNVGHNKAPADAVFIECHLIYEEPYGWFDGVNLVKRKVPVMVREKVRTFRRKLALADKKQGESKAKNPPAPR